MKTKLPKPAFWITNASTMNVTLADLALNIRAFTTVNLLDSRHYKYSLEQLLKSKDSGSLFKKRDKILVRDLPPPDPEKNKIPFIKNSLIPDRGHSIYKVEDTEYEELKVTDEDQQKQDELFAQENADLAEIDTQRSIINPPIRKV